MKGKPAGRAPFSISLSQKRTQQGRGRGKKKGRRNEREVQFEIFNPPSLKVGGMREK